MVKDTRPGGGPASRRVLALLLALVMMLSLAAPAWAEGEETYELPLVDDNYAKKGPNLPDTSYTPTIPGNGPQPARAQGSYEINGITYYNTYANEDEVPGDILIDLVDSSYYSEDDHLDRGLGDRWIQIAYSIWAAQQGWDKVPSEWTDAIFNHYYLDNDKLRSHYNVPLYTATLEQAAQRVWPNGRLMTPYTNDADGKKQQDVVAQFYQLWDKEKDQLLDIAVYFTDFKSIAILPEDKGNNYTNEVIKDDDAKDKPFNAEIINDSNIPVTATQNLTTSLSNTVSSSVNHSATSSLSTTMTMGTEIGFEAGIPGFKESAKISMSTSISASESFTDGWTKGESTTKSDSVSETASITLPPYTTAILEQGHRDAEIKRAYNCPLAIQYTVRIAVDYGPRTRSSDPPMLLVMFSDDARGELNERALQYGKFDVEITSADNAAVNWNKVMENGNAANIIKYVTTHVPFSPVGAGFRQKINASYISVKAVAPTKPLAIVNLLPPGVDFIDSASYTDEGFNYLKAKMRIGDSSFTNYLRLEGLNEKLAPYYGFSSLLGHWIVAKRDGTEWTDKSTVPIVLTKDEGSGYTRYTAVREGTCYLIYRINEDVYGTSENEIDANLGYTRNVDLLRTAALEVTVSGHKQYEEQHGKVLVGGSFTGLVSDRPRKLDGDGGLTVALEDDTGRRLSDAYYWEKQELDSDGILVNEENKFFFIKPGTYHVRAVCDSIDAYSDWTEIHVHEYTFSHGDTADTVKAECVEGDGVTGTLTIHAPAKKSYNDMSSPEATVTGSIPALDTSNIDIVYSWKNIELPEAPTEPGEYMASFTLDGVQAQVSYIIQGSYVINPPVARSLTYTGEAQDLVNPGKANDVMLYAIGGTDGSEPDPTMYSVALPQATYAGMYYVWYKAADHTGGFPDSVVYGPVPVEIAKAERPAPEAPTAAFITQNSITLTEIENGEYRIGSNPWQDSPVFDGLQYRSGYNFQQRYKEDSNYLLSSASEKAVIATGNMESLTAHPPYAKVLDYTGQPQELVVRGQPSIDHHRYYYYALGTDSTTQPPKEAFSSNIPRGTEMGAYYVWYTDEYYSYHCLTSWIKPVKGPTPVAKTVTAHRVVLEAMDNVMFAYDDHQSQPTAWDWKEVPDFEDLLPDTEYTFYAYYKETSVFPETPIGDGLTVRTAKTQDPIPKVGLMYNMEAQALLEGGVTDEGYEYRYAVKSDAPSYSSAIPTGTDAGSYSILFAVFDKANGNMVGSPTELEIPIAKAIPKLSFPNDRLAATGELQPLVVNPVVFPKVDGLTVYYSTDGFNDVYGIPAGDEIGIYRIYYRVDSTNPNVETIFYGHGAEIRIVGDVEELAPDLAVSIEDWTYDDEPKTPEITGNPNRIPITLSYKRQGADDSTYAASLPVDAGEYVVRAVAGSDLYDNTKTVTADFTVYQKYPVMGDDYDIRPIEGTIYDGEYQNLVTPTVRPDSSLRIWFSFDRKNTLAGTPKKRDAGTYDIWYKVVGDSNYVELTEWSGPVTAEVIGAHTVYLMPAEFGKLSVDKMSALPGETVTITATPDDEYALKTLVVRQGDMSVPFTRNADSTFSFTMPSTDVYVSALFAQSAIIGCDLRLDGTIGMRFYVVLSESFANSNAWMEFSIHDRNYEIPLSEADYIDGCHVFTCPVYSLEMAEPISAVFHYSDTGVARKFISIRQYLEDMRNAGLMDTNLLDAIANYGHYIQPYMGRVHGYTFGPDGDYGEMPAATQITALKELPAFRRQMGEHGWNKDVVSSMHYGLTLLDNTSLVFLFKLKTAPAAVSVTVDGEEWPVEKVDENTYRIEISNIAANNLGKAWHVELTADGTIVYDTYASALSFVDSVLTLNRAEDENLAVTALYDYYAAARNYAS